MILRRFEIIILLSKTLSDMFRLFRPDHMLHTIGFWQKIWAENASCCFFRLKVEQDASHDQIYLHVVIFLLQV